MYVKWNKCKDRKFQYFWSKNVIFIVHIFGLWLSKFAYYNWLLFALKLDFFDVSDKIQVEVCIFLLIREVK